MLGNLVILGISWLLLKLEHIGLDKALGFNHAVLRSLQLVFGFLATAVLAVVLSLVFSVAANFNWVPAGQVTLANLLQGAYAAFNSVLFEELLFRGYLLYKAIGWLGERKAVWLSAVAFGVYHWFSFGLLGNPVLMAWVFFYTGVWGLMFATAYAKTRSVALPVGLHYGWNLVDQYVFSNERLSVFEPVTSIHTHYLSALESMLYLRLPTIAFAVLVIVLLSKNRWAVKRRNRVEA